jgi:2-amino-4-hydroxy-6-hydroxymethyldihydropteridine diphosphokinase
MTPPLESAPEVVAYVGLGANLGEAAASVRAAADELRRTAGVQALRLSALYGTAPVDSSGPDYVNAVAEIRTTLAPLPLLACLQAIEQAHGRERPYRNAPRTLDLDLLWYGGAIIREPSLTVPHPRLHERAFVLRPLMDLAPDLPLAQGPLAELLARCAGQRIRRLDGPALRLVVAYCDNRVIGQGGAMPWHLPSDLAHFKRSTLGLPILMGRKTWASLQRRPLPGRRNLVLSRDAGFAAEGAERFGTLQAALDACAGLERVCVIGGEQIFRLALPRADEIFATEIHADLDGDTWFPALPAGQWRETERRPQPAENGLAFDFVTYRRVGPPA